MSAEINKDVFIFSENLGFICKTCGKCCRNDWTIYIGPESYFGLKDTEIYRDLKKKYNDEELFHLDLDKKECTINKFDGKCPMIQEDNLCLIHTKMGIEEKPGACRYFPYVLTPTPDGIYVGYSFNCNGVKSFENNHESDEELTQYLKQLLTGLSEFQFGFGEIPIYNEIVTDWDGYKLTEQYLNACLSNGESISDQLWKSLMSLIMLVFECRKNNKKFINKEEIVKYLEKQFEPPFGRDKDYQYQEFYYTMFIVTLLETSEQSKRQETIQALLNGGTIHSKTFRQEINIEQLMNYFEKQPQHDDTPELFNYFKHLVWRKEILKMKDLVTGLGMLNITRTLLDWYLYTSAFVKNAEKPDADDFKFAIGEVEEAIKHDANFVFRKYAGEFGKSLVDQVTLFMAN
jgi:Fe-S-cluster containining protein